MGLLTIGAFARASRLSPKALRLYDELGLLRPAAVDPVSGYRRYAPEQLDRARLVAWLRRLGMPLARIRVVCELDPGAAAAEVRAYWAQVEVDIAARRKLATFLIEELSGKETSMTDPEGIRDTAGSGDRHDPGAAHPVIRYAMHTDRGLVRESNQDTGYAGRRLLAVADGFGPSGQPASAAAIDALTPLDGPMPAGELLNALEDAVHRAGSAVGELGGEPGRSGTTLTAMVCSGSRLALVHVGDCRVYLLRGGEFFQITHDHTVVRSLIDEGRLTEEEAASHPQRSVLLRALHGTAAVRPDLELRDAHAGDRYLLCSDGLHAVVAASDLRAVLSTVADPGAAVRDLVARAIAAGGPDNVTCVVADLIPEAAAG